MKHTFFRHLAITILLSGGVYLPALTANAQGPAPRTAVPGEIILKAAPGMALPDVTSLANNANCDVINPIPHCPDFYLLRVRGVSYIRRDEKPADTVVVSTNEAIEKLKQTAGVSADPNYIVKLAKVPGVVEQPALPDVLEKLEQVGKIAPAGKVSRATLPISRIVTIPNDPFYNQQPGLDIVRMPEAWTIQTGIRPVVVGVADTGIDVGHPDFATPDGTGTRVLGGQNFFPDNGLAINPAAIQDGDGHGTHVAGTVGATTNNNTPTGVASVAGWNRNGLDVSIRVARVFGNPEDSAGGGSTDAIVYAGVGYLVDQRVDVINLSLGSVGFQPTAIELATINRAVAAGIVVVAAAGNDALNFTDFGLQVLPADIPGVIKVTAVDMNRQLSGFSNFGGPVSIAAPGGSGGAFPAPPNNVNILSTWIRSAGIGGPFDGYTPPFGPGYRSIAGTSMAAPHVAGAAAQLIAAGCPPNLVKTTLESNAQPPNGTPDVSRYGAGILDVYSSLYQYADPLFAAALDAPPDTGATFFNQLPTINVQVVGVRKYRSVPDTTGTADSLNIEIRTATFPSSVIRKIPVPIPSLAPGDPRAKQFTVGVGGPGNPISLPIGRFKAVLVLNGVELGSTFVEIQTRTQPLGRTMFAVPFKIPAGNTNPEQTLLGTNSQFSVARYNPLRLPSDFDYALYQSSESGRKDAAARFDVRALDSSPLTYEISNPAVSVAPIGLGYWLNLDRASALNTTGFDVAVSPVAIRLFSGNGGWNMIGAPFTVPSSWGNATVLVDGVSLRMDQAIEQGIISPALIGRNQEDYVYTLFPFGDLEPFNGYWVRVFRDCTLILGPRGTITRSVKAGEKSGTNGIALAPSNGWRGRLIATVAGDRDGQNYFGMVRGAAEDKDNYDIPKPPSGAGHSYVRFVQQGTGSSRGQSLAFDMRPLGRAGKTEWIAAVSTDRSNSDVTLTWDGLGNAPRRSVFTLTDTQTGRTVSMRNRSSFTFRSGEAGASRQFKITLTEESSAGPLQITNVSVVNSGRSVGYSVRFNTTRSANVTGVVKTVTGKVVGNLTGTTRAVGGASTTMHWTGRSQAGNMLPAGPYLLEITAQDDEGKSVVIARPIQTLH